MLAGLRKRMPSKYLFRVMMVLMMVMMVRY